MFKLLTKFIPTHFKSLLGAFLLGVLISMYVTHVFAEKDAANRLREALASKDREMTLLKQEMSLVRELDIEAMERMIAQERALSKNKEVVIKEIIKYVPQETDGNCNFSLGAVGLLNLARNPSGALSVSDATGLSDEALRAPSSHTPYAEIEQHVDCANRYNELSTRHNLLLDWIQSRENQQ